MIIPIRTEMVARRPPLANYALIAANCLFYFVFQWTGHQGLTAFVDRYLVLHTDWPMPHQFFTYQFLHGGIGHLAGNMLFLWVFGNSVNAKLGDWPYLLFYLAGGIFAGLVFAIGNTANLLGASGSIAAVTTAYLVLFPRSRVTVMYILFFIGFFELPAMVLILVKIILWDNILAPSFYGAGNVATEAHLGGYVFGFCGAGIMLWIRAVARDRFDLLALLDRWRRRRAFQATMASPEARLRAEFGTVARDPGHSQEARGAEEQRMDHLTELRARIGECLTRGKAAEAGKLYEELVDIDAAQCLSAQEQLAVAREYYATKRSPQAVTAFERFLDRYPSATDAKDIRLLVAIIYARDLEQYQRAEELLNQVLPTLVDGPRRDQCKWWLDTVRQYLQRPAADG